MNVTLDMHPSLPVVGDIHPAPLDELLGRRAIMRETARPSQFTMANLAHRLLRQTKNAKIPWQAVDEDGNKLIYSTCKSSVVIEICGVEEEAKTKVRLALAELSGIHG